MTLLGASPFAIMQWLIMENMENNTQQFLPAYDDMIKAGMHFGRKKTIFHPNMKPFVYSLKDNIYILDLIKTGDSILTALDFLKKSVAEGKTILFVGLTKQSVASIQSAAETLGSPYVINRWLGGTLTNFKTIISRVKYLEDLEKKQAENGFAEYTKKEKIMIEREMAALRQKFDGIRKLNKVPDIVFVSSLKESQLPVHEAKLAGVKLVGIVNTDSNPEQLDYPIIANDNSKKSVELIMDAIVKSLQSVTGQQPIAVPDASEEIPSEKVIT